VALLGLPDSFPRLIFISVCLQLESDPLSNTLFASFFLMDFALLFCFLLCGAGVGVGVGVGVGGWGVEPRAWSRLGRCSTWGPHLSPHHPFQPWVEAVFSDLRVRGFELSNEG
jgi:hypothetical protein